MFFDKNQETTSKVRGIKERERDRRYQSCFEHWIPKWKGHNHNQLDQVRFGSNRLVPKTQIAINQIKTKLNFKQNRTAIWFSAPIKHKKKTEPKPNHNPVYDKTNAERNKHSVRSGGSHTLSRFHRFTTLPYQWRASSEGR